MPIGEDMTTWQHWWGFNRDGHLRLRDAVVQASITGSDDFYLGATRGRETKQALVPGRALVVGEVLPALERAVAAGPRNVTVAGMLAMARIGIDHPKFRLYDVFRQRLAHTDQTTRETAAIALGLAGQTDPRCLELLLDLLSDNSAGRRAVGSRAVGSRAAGSTVNDRTRAFAAYGLGLLAMHADEVATKRRAFAALHEALNDRQIRSRDVRVAALQAISVLDIDQHKYEGARLAAAVLASLDDYFVADLGPGEQHIQAHCPTAIARLLGRDHPYSERYKERFAGILSGRSVDGRSRARRRVSHAIAQSCALAMGQLCRPNEHDKVDLNRDVQFSRVLLDVWHHHKDAQTRNFALLALGQIGGAANRTVLLREFRKASSSIKQPWCALALGLHGNARAERTGVPDALLGDTLLRAFRRSKNPESVAALAIGLGLARTDDSGEVMAKRLLNGLGKEAMAVALCQGLALLGDKSSRETLLQVIDESKRRPQLLENAAIALSRLGDPYVGELLLRHLAGDDPNYAMQVASSAALADVGDRNQVVPLLEVLADTQRSAITRAGAAQALGGIADNRHLRWNTPLRANANYRANVATLTDRFAGVLDLR